MRLFSSGGSLRRCSKLFQPVVPKRSQQCTQLRNFLAVGAVEPPRATAADNHQRAGPQDSKMLRNGGAADGELCRDFTRGQLVSPDERQDSPSRSVRQSPQSRIHLAAIVSNFLRKNQLTYSNEDPVTRRDVKNPGRRHEQIQNRRSRRGGPVLLAAVQPAVDSQQRGIGQDGKNDEDQDERHDRGYVAQV